MKFEILVGMIASGKSTYARGRANEGALVIAHDALTQMLHGGDYRYEQGLRECYRSMEERLAFLGLWHERDVIIDRTHLTRESRKRWIDFARDRSSVIAVAFPIGAPEVHANRRFTHDPRGRSYEDWCRVACHHADQAAAEPLSEDEGFARIVRVGNECGTLTEEQPR